MNKEKKALLLIWTYLIILFTPKNKTNDDTTNIIYNDDYICEDMLYGTYKSKNIYIIHDDLIFEEKNNNPDDIYIIDNRHNDDPNISIYDSYKFKNIDDIETIINLLIEYENNYPSNWNRTYKSMKNEWLIHNICYYLNIQTERVAQVDFNNEDEEIYLSCLKIIKEIINTNNNEIESSKTKTLNK